MTFNRIFYVAAFAESSNQDWFSLGRQRKTEQVISILSSLNSSIIRVNIAPTFTKSRCPSLVNFCTSSFIPLRYLQLLISSFLYFSQVAGFNGSSLIWLYNTRSAESLVAIVALLLRPSLRLILQLEDLPSARQLNHGISGRIDHFFTWLLSKKASHIFAVSHNVAQSFCNRYNYSLDLIKILPPLIDPSFNSQVYNRVPPFSNNTITIFYAGSYSPEKGVEDLIEAFLRLDSKEYELRLCGNSPAKLIHKYSQFDKIIFLGIVEQDRLFRSYASADIVVNPHLPILNSNYIFPFKLVEIIASGALPLTTAVPGSEVFGLPSECFFAGVDDLVDKLNNSRAIWQSNQSVLLEISAFCRCQYSLERAQNMLSCNIFMP